MTRKDYVLLAAACESGIQDCASQRLNTTAARVVVESVADALAQDNPRFDRARFLKAAGVAS